MSIFAFFLYVYTSSISFAFSCLQYRFTDQAAREIAALRNVYKELKPSNEHYGEHHDNLCYSLHVDLNTTAIGKAT